MKQRMADSKVGAGLQEVPVNWVLHLVCPGRLGQEYGTQIHFEGRTVEVALDVVRKMEVAAADVVHKADVAAVVIVVERKMEWLLAVVGRRGIVEVVHRTHDWEDMELA